MKDHIGIGFVLGVLFCFALGVAWSIGYDTATRHCKPPSAASEPK